jgi:hypothetical protein
MFPRTILLIVLLLAGRYGNAQQLFPVKVDGKWGYIDTTGSVVIAPQFEWASFFGEQHAVVLQNGNAGLVNKSGKLVQFKGSTMLEQLDDTTFAFQENGHWGIRLLNGKIVLPPEYHEVRRIDRRVFAFRKDSLWGFAGRHGNILLPAIADTGYIYMGALLRFEIKDKIGVVSLRGKNNPVLLDAVCDDVFRTNDSVIFYRIGNRWGGKKLDGSVLFEPEWLSYRMLSGKFVVLQCDSSSALINIASAKQIAGCMYDDYTRMDNRILLTRKDSLFGLIDTSGNVIFTPQFDDLRPLDANTWQYMREGKAGLLNLDGKIVTAALYDGFASFRKGFGRVYTDKGCGIMNRNGVMLVQPGNDSIAINKQTIRVKTKTGVVTIIELDANGNLLDNNVYADLKTIRIGSGARSYTVDNTSPAQLPVITQPQDTIQWFFVSRTGRWGLRNTVTDDTLIKPIFSDIVEYPQLGYTVVQRRMKSDVVYIDGKPLTSDYRYGVYDKRHLRFIVPVKYSAIRMDDLTDKRLTGIIRCIREDGLPGFLYLDRPDAFYPVSYFEDPVENVSRVALGGTWRNATSRDSATCTLYSMLSDFGFRTSDFRTPNAVYRKMIRLEKAGWCFINPQGGFMLTPKYDGARTYFDGQGIVSKNGKWGVAYEDKLYGEKFKIEPVYSKIGYISPENKNLYLVEQFSPRQGFVNRSGEIAVSASYEKCQPFSEGLAGVKKDGRWGYADSMGNVVIAIEYNDAKPFSEGLAAVKKRGKWGFIDPSGQVIAECKYESVTPFTDGCSFARLQGKTLVLDASGNELPFEKNQRITGFIGDKRIVKGKKGVGLTDASGNWILKPVYLAIKRFSGDSLFLVRKKQYGGIVDANGNWRQKIKLGRVGEFAEELCAAQLDGKWGFISRSGSWEIAPQFTAVVPFSEGTAAVKKAGRWGYINNAGAWVLEPKYNAAGKFVAGKAFVVAKNFTGFIDTQGKLLIELPAGSKANPFAEGLAFVTETYGKCYYINTEGRTLFGKTFTECMDFSAGVARVRTGDGWGMINRQGMYVIEPRLERIGDFNGPMAVFQQNQFFGVVDRSAHQLIYPVADEITQVSRRIFCIRSGRQIGYMKTDGTWLWELKR